MSRRVTKEQFGKGGVINPRRIEKALLDATSTLNNLPRGRIQEKWTPTQFVRSWSPIPRVCHHRWPFMRSINDENDIYTDSGDPEDISNEQREKGYYIDGLQEVTGDPIDTPRHYIWSETLFFQNPVILVYWSLLMLVDGDSAVTPAYLNDWEYGADDSKPEDGATGDPRRDFTRIISVDSELDREDRSLSDVVAIRRDFSLREAQLSQVGWSLPSSGNQGWPTTPAWGAMNGFYQDDILYIPIHAKSRVRISHVLPFYNDTMNSDHRGWNVLGTEEPWWNQTFNMNLVALELIENGRD